MKPLSYYQVMAKLRNSVDLSMGVIVLLATGAWLIFITSLVYNYLNKG